MPDGSKKHVYRVAIGGSVASLHRVAVGSVQEDDETGITLAATMTDVTLGEAMAVETSSRGPTLSIHDGLGADFDGRGGQIVFNTLPDTSNGAIDGTFDGIIAKASGSSDIIKVTSGVFHVRTQ